jgi:hypothetical protein
MTPLSLIQKRTAIALMALALLAIGTVLTLSHATGAAALECQASSFRLGVLCGLVWLAYPELIKLPGCFPHWPARAWPPTAGDGSLR